MKKGLNISRVIKTKSCHSEILLAWQGEVLLDYDFKSNQLKSAFTLAGFFPLFFKVADVAPGKIALSVFTQYKFLKSGGINYYIGSQSGQQWDAPNGWAPLQWICFKGLLNYNFNELAAEVRKRWLAANDAVFKNLEDDGEVWRVEWKCRYQRRWISQSRRFRLDKRSLSRHESERWPFESPL